MATTRIDGQQVLQDDQMSGCRSFGSNFHPSSQSRKISIGIVIDSLAKIGSGAVKEDEIAVLNAGNATNRERKDKGQGLAAASTSKQNEAPLQESSPWVNTKSFYQKPPIIETVYTKQTSSLPPRGRGSKVNVAKETPTNCSIQFFANQNSMLQSSNGNQKKFNRITNKRSGGNDGTKQTQKFSFSAVQGICVSDKGETEDKINKIEKRTSEALRMKLWEVLGTVSSPNNPLSGSQTLEVDANNSKLEPNFYQESGPILKARQNSDSIEPDSESPDVNIKRPVTRCLNRKRPPTKVQVNKVKSRPSSSTKRTLQEKSIFSLEVGLPGDLHCAANGSLQRSTMKQSKRSCPIEPRKICFHEEENADKNEPATNRSKAQPPSKKRSLLGNRMEGCHGSPHQDNGEDREPSNRGQEKEFPVSPVTEKADKVGDVSCPASPKDADEQEDLRNPSLNFIGVPQNDFQSPTFGMKTPLKSSSPISPPSRMEQGACSPSPAGGVFTVGTIHSFRTLYTPKRDHYGSKLQSESSFQDDGGELKDYTTKKSMPVMEEKDAGNESSKSSSEKRGSESSQEVSPIDEGYQSSQETNIFSPELDAAEKTEFMLHPGSEGSAESQELSEPNQKGGPSRAVSLFALALERMKSKVETVTSKRSSDIVMSVAEEIHFQLQNVQSQMQKDVGKLTSLSKLKRKRLETRFREQHEQLKLIHEKFKEEINRHLLDCRSSLDGLEEYQMELKRNVERQKASHEKLLLQVEEAIEIQLTDAQRRITAIHKMARQKMLQLKLVLGECLKEDILS